MEILNIRNLNTAGLENILTFCRERIANGEGAFLVPMNPIKVVRARNNPGYQKIIDEADLVFPDAWGMKWAASLLYGKKITLAPGYRVMFALLEQAERDVRTVYILGTKEEILEEAVINLKERHPRLKIAGAHHGFFGAEEEEGVFRRIAEAKPDYVFVAMGEQRQEEIIERLRPHHPAAVYLGVGGSVDLIAGHQPAPPEWMRRNHLEWLYRAVRQPFRLPRFRALPVFVLLVLAEKIGGRK